MCKNVYHCRACEIRSRIQVQNQVLTMWGLLTVGTLVMLGILYLSISGNPVNGVELKIGQRIFAGFLSTAFLGSIWFACPSELREYYRNKRDKK